MNDNDLIRRGDVIAILSAASRTAQRTIDAIAALAASQPADPVTNAGSCQPVRVKPLVWQEAADSFIADVYSVSPTYGQGAERFMLTRGTKIVRWNDQPEPLKAAAQSDYEARILAALEPAPHVNETPKREHDSADVLTAIEHAPTTPADAMKDVFVERQRQISTEGWTPEHDDTHINGEMAQAAACYALNAAGWKTEALRGCWPMAWASAWFKPAVPRRDLVKAGAMIIAEIERLDRAALRAIEEGEA